MKILLTGGTGLLGTSLIKSIDSKKNTLIATYVNNKPASNAVNFVKMDLSNQTEIRKTINSLNPELIIHAAAATNMEWCEENTSSAFKINSEATKIISEEAKKLGAKVVYISTDFVFDGERGNYNEEDKPNPLNTYGESKLRGEEAVLKAKSGLVIRSNMYGIDPFPEKQSFTPFIINNLKAGKEIMTADDQICSQIFAEQLSKFIMELAEKGEQGLFHITTKDSASRYEFAMQVCDVFGLDKNLVKKVKLADLVSMFKWKAKRPCDTSLDVTKAGKTFKLPTIKASLEEYKRTLETLDYGRRIRRIKTEIS